MKTSLNKYKRFRNNQTTSSEHKAIKLAISDEKKKKKKDWENYAGKSRKKYSK